MKKEKLTLNPAQIDPEWYSVFDSSRKSLAAQFVFRGEDVVVIVNALELKNWGYSIIGSTQPPVYGSEVQRQKIAK